MMTKNESIYKKLVKLNRKIQDEEDRLLLITRKDPIDTAKVARVALNIEKMKGQVDVLNHFFNEVEVAEIPQPGYN